MTNYAHTLYKDNMYRRGRIGVSQKYAIKNIVDYPEH